MHRWILVLFAGLFVCLLAACDSTAGPRQVSDFSGSTPQSSTSSHSEAYSQVYPSQPSDGPVIAIDPPVPYVPGEAEEPTWWTMELVETDGWLLLEHEGGLYTLPRGTILLDAEGVELAWSALAPGTLVWVSFLGPIQEIYPANILNVLSAQVGTVSVRYAET